MSSEDRWEYQWRRSDADDDDAWTVGPLISVEQTEISICCGIELGVDYDVRVRQVTASGRVSPWSVAEGVRAATPGLTRPAAPQDVRVGPCGVTWSDPERSPAIAGYRLRHAEGDVRTVADMEDAHVGLWPAPPFPKCFIPGGVRSIAVVAVDVDGNESDPVVSIVEIDDPIVTLDKTLERRDLATESFPGTVVGGTVAGPVVQSEPDANDFFWPQADGDDLFWSGDDATFWRQDDELFWNQDIGDAKTFWALDDQALFWATRYASFTYTFTITPKTTAAAPLLAVAIEADQPGCRIEFRSQDDIFWPPDPATFWDSDDDALFWNQDDGAWRPWPGTLADAKAAAVTFRVTSPGSKEQQFLTAVRVELSAAETTETCESLSIPAEGARLPLTKSYSSVRVASYVLHQGPAPSPAVALKMLDQDAARGPAVVVVDALGMPIFGVADVTVKGVLR